MSGLDKDFKLYIISGKARHGKSTLGSLIKEEYNSRMKQSAIIQFSHYIKDYAKNYFGWDGKEETKPRELLEKIGDIIRNKLNKPNFFIDRLAEDIEILSYVFDVIIVDDARFAIELDTFKSRFNNQAIIIHVERDDFDNGLTDIQKAHSTEIDLDNYQKFEHIIKNNGTIDNLREEAKKIIEQEENNYYEEVNK